MLDNTVAGDEVYFVTRTGVRTGKRLVISLMYVQPAADVLVVSSVSGSS